MDFSGANCLTSGGVLYLNHSPIPKKFLAPRVPYSLECQPLWRLDLISGFCSSFFHEQLGSGTHFNVSKVERLTLATTNILQITILHEKLAILGCFLEEKYAWKRFGGDGDLSCARSWDHNWSWSWLSPCQSPGTSEDCWPPDRRVLNL